MPVHVFFDETRDLFNRGRFDLMARQFRYPAAVYAGERLRLLTRAEETANFLQERRTALEEAGVAEVTITVNGSHPSPGSRLRSEDVWRLFDGVGRLRGEVDIVYFMVRESEIEVRIEMIDIQSSRGHSLFGETTERLQLH